MSSDSTMRRTVQVAVEAIVNNPEDYEASTKLVVFSDAVKVGVSALYLDMLRDIIKAEAGL